MIRLCLIIALTLILTPLQSYASTINDEGAKRLKSMFSTLIDEQRTKIEDYEGTLTTKDSITVEQASDYYAVTLPAFTVTNKDGSGTKIGLIAINATPTKNPDDWNLSIAIPTPLIYLDENGKKEMQVDIGSQQMSGLWDGKLKSFSKFIAKYNDVKITSTKDRPTITLDKIETMSVANENEDDLWSIKNKLKITGLNLNKPSIDKFVPKNISLNFGTDRFPLLQITEVIKNLTANTSNLNGQKIQVLQTVMQLPEILSNAGTSLTLTGTSISNDLYNINVNANFKAIDSSAIGVKGTLETNFEGIDKLIKALEDEHKKLKDEKITVAIKQLEALKKFSVNKGDSYTIKLTIDEDANILVNGKNLNETTP